MGSGAFPEQGVTWKAQAACFSMALSHALTEGGHAPETIEIDAVCRFEQLPGGGFGITSMDLEVQASVPGVEQEHTYGHRYDQKWRHEGG